MQRQGDLLLSEHACGHMYGITKAAVQAVQCQNKVSQQPASHVQDNAPVYVEASVSMGHATLNPYCMSHCTPAFLAVAQCSMPVQQLWFVAACLDHTGQH